MNKKTLILVALIGLLVGAALADVVRRYWFPNIGTITTYSLDIYLDDVFIANETAIDWGSCEPGFMYYYENFTVANTGSADVTVYITPQDLPGDWLLHWDGNDTLLTAGQSTGGFLNLTIPATATTWPTWGFHLRADA